MRIGRQACVKPQGNTEQIAEEPGTIIHYVSGIIEWHEVKITHSSKEKNDLRDTKAKHRERTSIFRSSKGGLMGEPFSAASPQGFHAVLLWL